MKKLAIASLLMLASAGSAQAATGSTATVTGTASANIVTVLKVTHNTGTSLQFGRFTAGTGGTIVVAQNGTGSVTGDVGTVNGSSVATDAFTVTGDGTRTFAISASSSNTVAASGGATMPFSLSVPATATLAAGSATVRVGGTLTVANNQAAGAYTGSYTLTVSYQ